VDRRRHSTLHTRLHCSAHAIAPNGALGPDLRASRRESAAIGNQVETLEGLLSELQRNARYYAAFAVRGDGGDGGKIAAALASLRQLADVPGIVVMRLYGCFDRLQTLSESEFIEAITLLESYLLRRAVCGSQTRGYGLEFAKLAYQVEEDRPLQSLKAALARMAETYAFPKDEEFRWALKTSDLYHKRICFFVLEQLENAGSLERSHTENYTIEHIMPQNVKLSRSWRDMLGSDWQHVQAEWLHRLGNLTLTGYNATYSDRGLDEKKTIKGGFSQSLVRLNQDVRDQLRWTEAEIRQRGQRLVRRAMEIWPALNVDRALINAAELAEKRARAENRKVDKVAMTATARLVFAQLQCRLKAEFPEAVELAEARSVQLSRSTVLPEGDSAEEQPYASGQA
jgi:Protein of unknown function (DUF1524)